MPPFDPPTTPTEPSPLPLAGLRVLAVEDHAIGRVLLEAMLSGIGVDATLVGSGEDAMRTAAREHFDVVLIDLGLPDVDGEDLAAALAATSGTRGAAIVAVTGRERPTRLPDAFCDWLQKPYSARALHDHLVDVGAAAVRRA